MQKTEENVGLLVYPESEEGFMSACMCIGRRCFSAIIALMLCLLAISCTTTEPVEEPSSMAVIVQAEAPEPAVEMPVPEIHVPDDIEAEPMPLPPEPEASIEVEEAASVEVPSEVPPVPEDIVEEDSALKEMADDGIAVFDGSGLLGTVPYSDPGPERVELRISLWESGEKREAIERAIERYESINGNVDIIPEFIEKSAYWRNVSTDAASGRLADVLEMDRRYLGQFVERGQLLDLSDVFDRLSGYGMPIGMTAPVLAYDESVIESVSIEFPSLLSIEAFIDAARAVYDSTGLKAGTSLGLDLLEAIAFHEGSDIYTEIKEGRTDSSAVFFNLVEDISAYPFLSSAGDWCRFTDATEIGEGDGYARITNDGLIPYALLSISASSRYPEEAAEFISWLVSSKEAQSILRLDFGIPPFRHVDDLVLTPAEKRRFDFIFDTEYRQSLSVPPMGNAEIGRILSDYAADVLSGDMDPSAAAALFVDESDDILLRAEGAGM